jgi:LmbE family N-acetylglucosaminyl deacetylase
VKHLQIKRVALIVAHPDDETLWAGGTILNNHAWNCYIICLCRGDDADRAPKFYKALEKYKSEGIIGTLDDSPEQRPLDDITVEQAILNLLPSKTFDLIISHDPEGEYTRHLRHEETGKAVMRLWQNTKISAGKLWTFAYEDGNKEYYPRAVENASVYNTLKREIWLKKYRIITETYGFENRSFEAETTPIAEAFWQFNSPDDAKNRLNQIKNQSA